MKSGFSHRKGRLLQAAVFGAGTLLLFCASGCASAKLPASAGTVPAAGQETDARAALRLQIAADVAEGAREEGLPSDIFETGNLGAYADFLVDGALAKGVPAAEAEIPIAALVVAFALEKSGEDSRALGAYADVAALFPDSDFAAEALYRQGAVYSARRQFDAAFECFSALEDSYPSSPRVDDAVVQAYLVAEMVRNGVRPLKGGWFPWFRDRNAALAFYDRLYEMAPHLPISPRLLYHKGMFAFELSREWFAFDKTLEAIDAFERLISIYPDAQFVPDAYLELAETYEAGIVGAEWDQLSTRRAINYYTDFYSLFPEHPLAESAYDRTVVLTNLLAANRLAFGDFYYSRHNNLRAALTFYNEAITLAPDSPAGKDAQKRIERIRRGERSERTLVDWIFGRYPNYDAGDYFDAPSLKPLDEMGFRSGNAAAQRLDSPAAPANEGYRNPGED